MLDCRNEILVRPFESLRGNAFEVAMPLLPICCDAAVRQLALTGPVAVGVREKTKELAAGIIRVLAALQFTIFFLPISKCNT
jgi:hypothetical protein